MADWDALAKDAGLAPAASTSEAPPDTSAARMTLSRGGQPRLKNTPTPVPVVGGQAEQADRFAADVAARAAGQFAGWPADTVNNIVNLGRATIGSIPQSLRLVGTGINAVGGEYMGSLNPARGLAALANTIEPSWPKPDLYSAPVGGSQQITQGFRNLLALTGSPPQGVAPTSATQDFIGNVGEMAGGAAGMGVPTTGLNAAKLAASLVGSEAGRRAVSAVAPNSTIAPILGQLAGGLVVPSAYATGGPSINAGRALLNVGKDISGKATPAVQSIINDTLQSHVAGMPQSVANIDASLNLQKQFPGVKLSVAEMTGAPGLASMQSVFARLTPQNLNREVSRLQNNIAILKESFNKGLPDQGVSPDALPTNLGNVLKTQEAALTAAQQQLSAKLSDQSQRGAGQSLIDLANQERQSAKGTNANNYQQAFDAAGKSKIDVSNVLTEAEGILGRKLTEFAPETAPNTVRALRSFEPKASKEQTFFGEPIFTPEGAAKTPTATLPQLDDVRKAINADIQQAKTSSSPTSDMTLRNLYKLHGAIDDAVANSTLPEAAKTSYANALSTYRTQYAPRFKEGVNANLFRQTSLGEPKLNPDDVVRTYFQPAGEREASQFVTMFGKNPQAIQIAKAGILDLFRQKAVDKVTGLVNPNAAATFMTQYKRPMDIMDASGMGLRGQLQGVVDKANQLASIKTTTQQTAKSLNFDNPEAMKTALLASPSRMNSALSLMSSPDKQAFVRSVLLDAWKPIEDGAANAGSKFADYMANNERGLRAALSSVEGPKVAAQHYTNLRYMGQMLKTIEKADIGSKLVSSTGNDPLKAKTGVSIPTVWSQLRAVGAGREGVGTAIAMVAAPAITKLSQVQFNDVMNTALHDPKTALALRAFLTAGPTQAPGKAGALLQIYNAAKYTAKAIPGIVGKTLGTGKYGANLAPLAPTFAQQGADAVPAQ